LPGPKYGPPMPTKIFTLEAPTVIVSIWIPSEPAMPVRTEGSDDEKSRAPPVLLRNVEMRFEDRPVSIATL